MAIPQRGPKLRLVFLCLFAILTTVDSLAASTPSDMGTLTCSPTSLNFGTVSIGQSVLIPVTLTNTGKASLTITHRSRTRGVGFSGSGFVVPTTLAAGQSTSFSMTFAPNSTGPVSGDLTITSNASDATLTVPLSGTGITAGGLVAVPSSLSFGSVQVGNSETLPETLTNTGTNSVTISKVTTTGTGFSQQGVTAPLTLTAGQSVTFSSVFAPLSAGSASGAISVVSTSPTMSISLAGNGSAAGSLSVSPSTLNFGSVTVGTTSSKTGTLSATGTSVVVSSGTSNSPEFVLSGLSFPVTIAAGQSASFSVAFTPQSTGTASATLTLASNASNSSTIETLTGTGAAAPPHSVSLNWNASTSVVAGYNTYRSQVTGGPYTKLNASLDAVTSYTDESVSAGQTYYYVTTAVDSSGDESTYSNEVKTVIPTP